MNRAAAIFGLSAVTLFGAAVVLFSVLNPDFEILDDYVSKLGAVGQPYALWWNLIGFVTVGGLIAAFGWAFGHVLRDRVIRVLLILFGVGFAATGVPVELHDDTSPVSKVHVVAICLGLAAWLLGLARLGHIASVGRSVRWTAQTAAALVVLPIIAQAAGLWAMPLTHRLVFLVVFGWMAVTSVTLLRDGRDLLGSSRSPARGTGIAGPR